MFVSPVMARRIELAEAAVTRAVIASAKQAPAAFWRPLEGGMFVHDGIALLTGSATLPACRRRGVQATRRAVCAWNISLRRGLRVECGTRVR